MKKLLLFALFLILLPCFAFGATPTPPSALKIKPAQVKEVKVNTQKIKPGQIKKRPENSAMKIISITFQTTSTGNWGFVYEVINPGLVDFAANQLRYTAVQILRNGNASRIPILRMTNRRGHPHGVKRTYHSPLYRCSLVSTVELEISYKGKVLDKMTVRVPPMNVKIIKAYSLNGRYTAHLKNNTNYVAKVTLRTVARVGTGSGSGALISHIDSSTNSVLGAQTIVTIPANSTKVCTGTVVKHGQNPSLQVIFKDERKCIGKGYILLASKALAPPSTSDLVQHLTPKGVSGKVKADMPTGVQNGPVKIQLPFKIVGQSLYNKMGVNRTFTVSFDFSANVNPGTMKDSVVKFYLKSYENNYSNEIILYGKWENTTGKKHLRWTTSPVNSNFQMVDYGVGGNYLQISVSVNSTIKSDKGAWLDGDADGIPGGMPYKHTFYIGK